MSKQQITLTVGTTDLNFTVSRDVFNKYTNEMAMTNRVAPSHNFLMRAVDDDSKDTLKEFIKNTPGSEVQLAGSLAEEYTPDLEIVAKKRSSKPSK